MTNIHTKFMAQALALARRGLYTTHPNPRVGCIIIKDNSLVGSGYHLRAGESHAEEMALVKAGAQAQNADVYVTLEPCAHQGHTKSCAKMLIRARVRKVYIATIDPNPLVAGKGIEMLRQAGIAVKTGILEEPARELNIGFLNRHEQGRPWIRCKLATSLDGATSVPQFLSKENKWITDEAARHDVQLWRARSSAIISSAKSVSKDNARLNVRASLNLFKQPLRVLLDSNLALNPNSLFFKTSGAKLWVGAEGAPAPHPIPRETEVIFLPKANGKKGGICLQALIKTLTEREINEILVEAGKTLITAFFGQKLADEFILYIAPRFLGQEKHSMATNALGSINEDIQFKWEDVRFWGKDLRVILRLINKKIIYEQKTAPVA